MEKRKFRVLIKHYFLRGISIKETEEKLVKYCKESAPSHGMVHKWFTKFRCGRISTSDAERPGHPKDVTSQEMIDKIHDIVLNDRRLKVRESSETVNISVGRVWHILHESLGIRKLSAGSILCHTEGKRPHLTKKVLFHHDNAQSTLFPRFGSFRLFLFPNIKTWLGGKIFSSNEDIIVATNEYFEGFDKNYFLEGIKKLEYRYNKCIQLKGDYVEK